MRILLSDTGMEALRAPASGHGDFAMLVRKLQGLTVGNMLLVSKPDYERLRRYADGEGGADATERARCILHRATVS